MIVWVFPHIAWCVHGTMISISDILVSFGKPFLSGIVAAALAFAAQCIYGQLLSPFPRLLLGGSVLIFTYLFMLLFVMGQKAFYLNLIRELKNRSSSDKDSA